MRVTGTDTYIPIRYEYGCQCWYPSLYGLGIRIFSNCGYGDGYYGTLPQPCPFFIPTYFCLLIRCFCFFD